MLLKSDTMSLQQLVQLTSVYKTACLFSVHVMKSVSEIVLVSVRFLCRNFSFYFVLVYWITIILVLVLCKRRPIILVLVLIFVTKITLLLRHCLTVSGCFMLCTWLLDYLISCQQTNTRHCVVRVSSLLNSSSALRSFFPHCYCVKQWRQKQRPGHIARTVMQSIHTLRVTEDVSILHWQIKVTYIVLSAL